MKGHPFHYFTCKNNLHFKVPRRIKATDALMELLERRLKSGNMEEYSSRKMAREGRNCVGT